MWPLVAAVFAFTYSSSKVSGQAAAVGDAVNVIAFSWPSEQQRDPEAVGNTLTVEASDAVLFEDDAGIASRLYMTEQAKDTGDVRGITETGPAGLGVVDTKGAVPADTDLSYMDTHILHAPAEATTIVSESGRHSETAGMMGIPGDTVTLCYLCLHVLCV